MKSHLVTVEKGSLPGSITGKIPAPEAFALTAPTFPGRKPGPVGVEKLFNRGDTSQTTNTTTNTDSFNTSTSSVWSDLGNVDFRVNEEQPKSGVAGTVSAVLPLLLVGGAVIAGLFILNQGSSR